MTKIEHEVGFGMINLKFGDLLGIKADDRIINGLVKAVYLGKAEGSIGERIKVIISNSKIIEVELKDVVFVASSNWDGIWEQKNE